MVIRKDRKNKVGFKCQIAITAFGDRVVTYVTVCHRKGCDGKCCGFYGFCQECDKRYICATERKCNRRKVVLRY